MATVVIPTALRQYVGGQEEIGLSGGTVDAVLGTLTEQFPDLRKQLYNENGRLRNFVNVYLNDDDVRYLQKGETLVAEGDTISIIPAIAGGRSGTLHKPGVTPPPVAPDATD